ncbi:MAG TPA: ester cyclase [Gemmatimonadales bacterium]|nr:ester cyclase [Gemmatimonadales bacterium]
MKTRIAAVGLAVGALVALGGLTSRVSAQDAEQNKALFSVVVNQVYNAGDLALADDLVAKNVTSNGTALGRDGFKAMVKDQRAAGKQYSVDELVSDGDRVIGRVTQSGGGPSASQILVFRIQDGQIVEAWSMADAPALRQQFGLRGGAAGQAASAN